MEPTRCPSMGEWIKKLWYIYTMEYYSAIKNNNIMAFAEKWMELENIMLSEISQSQKTKGRMFSLISEWWYIIGVWRWGVTEECRNFRLCRVEWEGRGYERWWNEKDLITLCTCMITRMVWIYIVLNHRKAMMYPICVQWIKMQSVKLKKKKMSKILGQKKKMLYVISWVRY